ncbi:MAG: Asp-tRNA(Asn)/Glu-tRNA(Gln) amidotransferase subunit GatA [Candidatus Wildermuthbacteria bacterium]|nr:Asp-tRNA(Asn)/Glu-tRNA(Gln) amidotransferase subunit GatA [Candidatus Wildermuthbacteria bacterium]
MDTIASTLEKLSKKEISAKELCQQYLAAIAEKDKDINAFITPTPDIAISQAKEIDEKIAKGESLPSLAGIPYSLKDAILVKDTRCTAASKILENYVASYDATVAKRLQNAGAVLVGKTNMDEFGMGASTENSAFGPTKNPHDFSRVAGGSSGGSAASVSAGECMFSLGEDTGGSIRQPASFCGVVGLKPTYGTVSRHGIIALASSLDQVGPFAKTIEDAETIFRIISGKDPFDSTSVKYEYTAKELPAALKNLRVGVPKEYFSEGLDPKIETVIKDTFLKLEKEGAQLVEIELPNTKYALAAYYIINTSEASSNLARYDGIRFGRQAEGGDLLETYLSTRGTYLGNEVKRRIMLGTYALSAGYYEAFYVKAQKIRTLLAKDFEAAFQKVDVVMGPVCPFLPFRIGERIQDPLAMYLGDIYTVPVNLVGLPALSLPVGFADNLPVGLHIIAPAFREEILFGVGKSIEQMS